MTNVECTVSEIYGLAPLGTPPVIPSETYVCTTDAGSALFFDGDVSALLGEGYVPGETKLSLVPNTISSDGRLSVQQAMDAGAVVVNSRGDDRGRKLTTTGTKLVLVILVTNGVDKPSQSEQDMYNAVFEDANNLVSVVSVAIR